MALYESQECRGTIAFTEGSLVPTDGSITMSCPHWTQQRSQVPRELGMTCSDHCAKGRDLRGFWTFVEKSGGAGVVACKVPSVPAVLQCLVLQSCLTLCSPVDCGPPGSLSMGFPDSGIKATSPALAGGLFTNCATCA